ncbi:hypothetical protein [Spiroplasma phoeniceum]|uniref:Uncharacterized protein n=2 Tax=Spiroplasma TaxID=2132 RepID=A0A345DLK3_9MOLU|nr:hypothetical protein [Spiroplasma phoeniceum]AXF95091.1 hypothetical protein SDAV_0075 [Spiroplasma phoeniceum P40]AXF95207.1 hypothetical protein SDAV_00212 [Spiroplasma phoeniceum P40]AXF96200.1 hypothetical protein SDAV_001233 [Spiroplasma phoeniceum P40]
MDVIKSENQINQIIKTNKDLDDFKNKDEFIISTLKKCVANNLLFLKNIDNDLKNLNNLIKNINNFQVNNKSDADYGTELKILLKSTIKKIITPIVNNRSELKIIDSLYRYITKSFEKLETDVIQIEILTKQINWMNAAENQLKELNNNKENNLISEILNKEDIKVKGLKTKLDLKINIIDIEKVPEKFIIKTIDEEAIKKAIKENNNEIPNINGLEILYEKKHHF